MSSKNTLSRLQAGLKSDLKTDIRIASRMNAFMQIVQMSHLELQQTLKQKLTDNPLLEWSDEEEQWAVVGDEKSRENEDNVEFQEDDGYGSATEYADETAGDSFGQQIDTVDHDRFEQIDESYPIDNQHALEITTTHHTEKTFEDYQLVDEHYYPENVTDAFSTDDLLEQIPQPMEAYEMLWLDAKNQAKTTLQKQCVSWLIECLNEKGWIETPWEEIITDLVQETSFRKSLLEKELSKALAIIQSLEPAGIGARNLQECLQLQIMRWPKSTLREQCLFFVTDGYEAMRTKNYSKLAQQLSCSIRTIKSAIHAMASLDFHPGATLQRSSHDFVVPEVVVRKYRGEWQVMLNDSTLPKIRLNRYYASLVRYNRQAKEMRNQLHEAKFLLSDLDMRSEMIFKIAKYIVKMQRSFFELGELGMRPLQQREIADDLGVHPSTISRVIHHKYMDTPRGTLSFQSFFNRGRLLFDSGGYYSSTAILSMMKDIIAKESPLTPLSDEEIANTLKQHGVKLSRRSVAKYRIEHQIPSSHHRHHHKKVCLGVYS